jgi:hypothetical protein
VKNIRKKNWKKNYTSNLEVLPPKSKGLMRQKIPVDIAFLPAPELTWAKRLKNHINNQEID